MEEETDQSQPNMFTLALHTERGRERYKSKAEWQQAAVRDRARVGEVRGAELDDVNWFDWQEGGQSGVGKDQSLYRLFFCC